VFVDRVQIEVAAGNGGRGMCSFRREKYVPKGGPDGGDGGHGGSVILEARAGVDSLAPLAHRRQWRADHGAAGGPANCHGRNAADLTLLVPPGTIVIDESTGLVLKDLAAAGDSIVAEGGAMVSMSPGIDVVTSAGAAGGDKARCPSRRAPTRCCGSAARPPQPGPLRRRARRLCR
jgi:GTPase involved in cell partitioning and DNA repair